MERVEIEAEIPGKISAPLAPGKWRVEVLSASLWCPEQILEAKGDESQLELKFYPAGMVVANLDLGKGSELPASVELRFQSSANSAQKIASTRQSCPLENGLLECRLPALPLDLRIEVAGLIPHYSWDFKVPAGVRKRLGTLKLRRGSSLVGLVETPRRDFSFQEVQIVLTPLSQRGGVASARQRISQLALEARVNEQGFFQIKGARPGRYALVVAHPHFAPTRFDVTVRQDEELELAPLSLSPAARLILEIDHPTDPYLKPWTVRLARRGLESGHLEEVLETRASGDGVLEKDGLEPGEYQIGLIDSRGSRWHVEEQHLFPGVNALPTRVRFRRLVGTLLLDGEPLVGAEVELEEHEGSARFRYQSREEGKFYAFLPTGASWNLKVTHEPLGVIAAFAEFVVPRTERGKNHAEKTFEIPNTRFFGEVVEADGRPVQDPLVLSVSGELSIQKLLPGNSFDYRGFSPGLMQLEAAIDGSISKRDASSRQAEIELSEGLEQGPIRLVLEDHRVISGLVVAPDGQGVPGARVIGLVESNDDLLLRRSIPETTTDIEGVFELPVPAASEFVQLTVFPLGFAIAQQRIDLRSSTNGPVILPVDTTSGTVTLQYEIPEAENQRTARMTRSMTQLVAGHVIPGITVIPWTRNHGISSSAEEWVIPGLPPGPISACFGLSLQAWLLNGGELAPELAGEACVEGEVTPGGNLVLTIPEQVIMTAIGNRPPAN